MVLKKETLIGNILDHITTAESKLLQLTKD
jgi:hypothetical protein